MHIFSLRSKIILCSLVLISGIASGISPSCLADDRGVDGKIGHTALSTVGRDTGITYLELFPYIQTGEEQILFGDIRGFLTNDGNIGVNLTTGYRFLEPSNLFVLGINTSFDFDQSSEKTYQQLGFGLEGQTSFGSISSNFYFPIGDDEQVLSQTIGDVRVVGGRLVVDSQDIIGVSMRGLDSSIGFNLPGDFAQQRQMEATFGWYHFEGNNVATINGFKIQLDGQLSESFSAHTAFTKDDTFGSNVTVGLDWRFGSNGLPESQLEQRLRRLVKRNYNVVLSKREVTGIAVPLVAPTTGVQYNVQHVGQRYSILGGSGNILPRNPTGDKNNPWQTIADAQNAGGNIFIVESGTSLNENIILAEGQILTGDTTALQIETANFGTLSLPGVTNNSNNTPAVPAMITTTTGTGITLGNNSRIAGLTIDAPIGNGILADGVSGFSVEDVTIKNATGNGIEILNASNGSFRNIMIEGGDENGIFISQADGDLTFEDVLVSDVAQNGIFITGGQGVTDFQGDVTLNGNKQAGVHITGLTSPIVSQLDAEGNTIEVTEAGTVLFDKLIIDAAPQAQGVHLENNEGFIRVDDIDVKTTGATSVFANDSGQFAILDGTLESKDAPAIEIENTEINLRLESVSVDGGPLGIGLKQAKGQLLILGSSQGNVAGSGGLIQNADLAFRIESSGTVATKLLDYTGNKTIAEISNSELFRITQSQITGTTQQFVNANNLRVLEIDRNTFENNTLASQAGIQYTVQEVGGYVIRVANNIVRESPGIFIDVNAKAGGEFATLNYVFAGNEIEMDKQSAIASRLNWIGSVDASFSNNLVTGSQANQTGFQFLTQLSNASSTFVVAQNSIGFTAANGTAIAFDAQGAFVANISQNKIEFAGRDGVGINISGKKTSRISLTQNSILDNAGGATGILFPTLHDGTTIGLNANSIDLSNFNTFVDRGIILNTVTGDDDPIVRLESELNNAISGATTTLSVPANSISGRVIINNQILR